MVFSLSMVLCRALGLRAGAQVSCVTRVASVKSAGLSLFWLWFYMDFSSVTGKLIQRSMY